MEYNLSVIVTSRHCRLYDWSFYSTVVSGPTLSLDVFDVSFAVHVHVHLFFFGGEEEDSIHYGYLIGYLDAMITSDKVN